MSSGNLPEVVKSAPIDTLIRPFKRFIQIEASSGIILIIITIISLILANTTLKEFYHHLLETKFLVGFGTYVLNMDLEHWINDGLMAIFFFVVGLEIKREMLTGELSSLKKSSFPIFAALGGMIFPALIYSVLNWGHDYEMKGWGIPMATDIAFSLGILSLLGNRVPLSLKIFLTAFAIVDDLGAVIVIAVFYTANLSLISLGIGGIILLLMFICNFLHVRHPAVYLILGIGLWLAMLNSGVHATIAGVLASLTIPTKAKIDVKDFVTKSRNIIDKVEDKKIAQEDITNNIEDLEDYTEKVLPLSNRMEHDLHLWVAFLIMPIFAFANAGVTLEQNILSSVTNNVTLGIILGLFLGKQIGITLFCWLAVKMKLADLPEGTDWKMIYGTALLGGIGFTMSLFISSLAFTNPEIIADSKIGILCASLISAIMGYFILKKSLNTKA
ncbi:MAG: Na+/H+ antiporter NhaA [Bacteroidetes bacterium]|nr:Na+/H+ antiporter NhaA [Bacteroidota bacterium]